MLYKILYWTTFWIFHIVIRSFVWESNVQGLEKLKNSQHNLIVASNHRGRFDGIWIWYYFARMNRIKPVDMRIVTGERFFIIPIVGWYLKKMRCFPVTTGKGVEVLDPMVQVLQDGKIVTIFPEGKMQKHPDHKGDAKRGVGYLLWKSQAPLLPIYINYRKKWKWLPIWDMHFVVGEIKLYDIIKSDKELKQISDEVLESIYKLENK